jgi:hypothetical protein
VIGQVGDTEHPAALEYLRIGRAFNAEDRAKLEALQRGLKSRYFEPGPLAPDDLEGTVRDFHRYLAGKLGGDCRRIPIVGGRSQRGISPPPPAIL